METKQISSVLCFECRALRYEHNSAVLGGLPAKFHLVLPPQSKDKKVPIIFWLSGLTCTDENFIIKAGAFKYAKQYGVALVVPDTSPRGAGIPTEDDAYDFGSGAGFYVNAITEPWKKYYNMYDYITKELPSVLETVAGAQIDLSRCSIFGHSMGGHGALIIALKNPNVFCSVSAFAPISNPCECPWGHKCFTGYLGEDKELWKQYDATELLKARDPNTSFLLSDKPILVDQGTQDSFLENQLLPDNLVQACKQAGQKIDLRMQQGYDHSYFFIATFIEDHIKMHAEALYA